MKFSIITVSYNPGEKLRETLMSVAEQTCTDYEIIVKDGGSTDGSTDFLKGLWAEDDVHSDSTADSPEVQNKMRVEGKTAESHGPGNEDAFTRALAGRVRFIEGKDAGIYDAMNQAAAQVRGEYILFLNCGDKLADKEVLARTSAAMEKAEGDVKKADIGETETDSAAVEKAERDVRKSDTSEIETGSAGNGAKRYVFYGDTVSRRTGAKIASPPRITGFACYRNIPCHQSCFYSAALCREKPFELQYKVRADYDHFLWCFYQGSAEFVSMGFPVSSYEGGGYSENRENAARDRQEHRQITSCYVGSGELLRYRGIMALTLAPLRRRMTDSRIFSGLYHRVKDMVYRRKLWLFVAVLFFLIEVALFIWPVRWLGQEEINYLTGVGGWALEWTDAESGVCQEFIPDYSRLGSLSIFFYKGDDWAGSVRIVISDEENEVVFCKDIPYAQLADAGYTDIDVNIRLSTRARYFLTVNFIGEDAGTRPTVMVCGREEYIPENKAFLCGEEIEGVQLVTRYVYEDAISAQKLLMAVAMFAFTALLIAIPRPNNRWVRKIVCGLLLFLLPVVLGQRLERMVIYEAHVLPNAILWNTVIMYILELILLLCTNSACCALIVTDLLLTVIYSADYFVYLYRGAHLKIYEI